MSQLGDSSITQGNFSGIPAILIRTPFASAAISFFGAQVLSYCPNGEADWLWLSRTLQPLPNSIRGGIPLCWPWFAKEGQDSNAAQHGLARTTVWDIAEQKIDSRGAVRMVLRPALSLGEYLHAQLEVQLTVTISDMLHLSLQTTNRGTEAFTLTQAFHTYLAVADANQVVVEGLENTFFLDKLNQDSRQPQLGVFHELPPFDRIYQNTQGEYQILDRASGNLRLMGSTGSKSVVLWNPAAAAAAGMSDVGAQWRQFVCVEVGTVRADKQELAPRQTHILGLTLS
jgi:glucose-6-phosphate 1-epimerase